MNRALDLEEPNDGGDASPLAIWLREAMRKKGLSAPQLSRRSGLSRAAINKIESGVTRNLREATRKKLETALGMTVPEQTAREIAEESEIIGLGKLEDFDPHNSSERPKEPGLYVFYDISERPIYVGQAQNVKMRIAEHEEKFWFRRPIVETASWIKIVDAKLRKQIEQLMIRFLKRNAVINKQHVERSEVANPAGFQPRKYRPAVDVAASLLSEGPLHITALLARMKSAGARSKDERSLSALLSLAENQKRFEHIGGKTWGLRKLQ